jgi:hypothetical protein
MADKTERRPDPANREKMAAWQMSRLPALGTACPAIALAPADDAALQRFGFRISIPDSDSDCIVPAQSHANHRDVRISRAAL